MMILDVALGQPSKVLMKYFFLFFIYINIYSQNVELNGNVSSNYGPVSYANLILLGSNIGTVADENGDFKLKVDLSSHETLFISSVGYISQKISLKDSLLNLNNLVIILEEDLNGLSEVVITGSLKDEFVTESSVKVLSLIHI